MSCWIFKLQTEYQAQSFIWHAQETTYNVENISTQILISLMFDKYWVVIFLSRPYPLTWFNQAETKFFFSSSFQFINKCSEVPFQIGRHIRSIVSMRDELKIDFYILFILKLIESLFRWSSSIHFLGKKKVHSHNIYSVQNWFLLLMIQFQFRIIIISFDFFNCFSILLFC